MEQGGGASASVVYLRPLMGELWTPNLPNFRLWKIELYTMPLQAYGASDVDQ